MLLKPLETAKHHSVEKVVRMGNQESPSFGWAKDLPCIKPMVALT